MIVNFNFKELQFILIYNDSHINKKAVTFKPKTILGVFFIIYLQNVVLELRELYLSTLNEIIR